MSGKRVSKKGNRVSLKEPVIAKTTHDCDKCVWIFDGIDKDGCFAFDLHRKDFDHQLVLDKLLSYSAMTWGEIKKQTHDNGKSKHHSIPVEDLSKKAQARISKLGLFNETEKIFSFALTNKLRIVGIRDKVFFRVMWYDPEHEVYKCQK